MKPSTTFTDRLSLARERLNIALDPAARAARAGREPGASLDAAAEDPYAGEAPGFVPAGMMADPAATNFGRLAEARTDVPRFVMAGEAPAGLTPGQAQARTGIDVTGYVGSRYAGNNNPQGITPGLAAAAPAPAPATTMLPTGNLAARDALLRAAFPNADRRGVQGLGALAFNRPEAFNTAVAGTALDATAAEARRKQGEASLAATKMGTAASQQGMTFQQELQPGALAAQSLAAQATGQGIQTSTDEATRRATGDAAAQNFFSASADPAIRTAASNNAPAPVLFDMAKFALDRGKPLPGSQGVSVQMVPGFGNIARDNATGETISSGNFINDSTKPLEADVAFQSNVDVATTSLDQLENFVKKYGTWESGWAGNPEAAAGLESLPYKIAIQTAKIVDPGSVAREGEVAAAQKYIIPLGMFANKETALAAINQHRKTIKDYGSAREKASGAIKKPGMTPGAAPAANSGGAPAAPANAQAATHFTDTDGTKRPIVTAGNRRGVIKDGMFYPIIP